MFHRVPSFYFIAVATTALIFLLATLFASSLSSPGTAHASHPDLPEVSIASITPEVGEEGGYLRVTLRLSRALTVDEKFCYPGRGANEDPTDEICIQGGIIAWDSYNDHLSGNNDGMVKFVFGEGSRDGVPQEDGSILKRWTVSIKDDSCITPRRTIRIGVNTVFDDTDTYGYLIDETLHSVPVHGDDTTNTGFVYPNGKNENGPPEGTCKAINEGDDEEVIANRAPTFGKNPITLSVNENTESGEDIGSPVTAHDEENDDLTYSLTGADANHFDIDFSNGQILTDGDLDHETKDTYQLFISVTDNKDIYGDPDSAEDDSLQVTISVKNVNEPPVFDANAPTALNVMENTAAGVDIGTPVTATDPEDDPVTYELDDGDGASFEIDTNTGQIKTKDALDRETKDSYTVTVTASDDGGASATHDVTITVTEANDPPVFTDDNGNVQTSVPREVAENTPADQPVGDPVAAIDEENDTLTYSLGGTDAASFDFETTTGQIKTKSGVDLDYEGGTTSYSVTVSVTDGKDINGNAEGTPTEDATIEVTIEVTDVNEPPAFADDAPATQTVAENTAADTDIGSAYTATDPDTTNDTLTYTLDSGSADTFDIAANGQLKTKADLNYEAASSYTVIVQVTDSKDDNGVAEQSPVPDDTITVTITITDEDDPGSITFSSDPPIAGTPLTAVLEDQDGVKRDVTVTWKWEISTDQTNWNTITDATTDSYTPGSDDIGDYLRVTATYDDEKGPGKTVEAETDAVLTAPATNTDASFADLNTTRSVPENTAAGQPIGAPVAAVDPDNEDTLTYSLGGTDAASFDIDTSNGQLKTKDALDFDDGQTTYSVDVSVTDSKDDYDTTDTVVDDTIDVTISVTDVNEKPVFADDAPITQTVAENTAADTDIGSAYTATDDDQDTLTYSLGGADAASFAIDDSTGQLKTKGDLNYEADSSYTVIVQVTDSRDDNGVAEGTPTVDDTHAVTITLTDQDDDGSITLSSDPPSAGTTVTATLEDQDGVKAGVAVTWLWEISIDQTNWNTITDATTDSYTPGTDDIGDYLRVTATYEDELGAGKTAQTESGAILTAPATNTDASFADLNTTRSVPENTAAGQPIGAKVAAVDPDNEDTLTYSLGGTDAASFDIDSSNGQLKTKDPLDFDAGQTTYSVDVVGQLTARTTMTLRTLWWTPLLQ